MSDQSDITTDQLNLVPPTATPEPSGVAVTRSVAFPAGTTLPFDRVTYGPDIADESALRLLGNLEGKRVLELGSGGGHSSVAMARQGAHVISVDPSAERLDAVRVACEREEVKVEVHHNDLADLAFVRADTVDVVLSIYALAAVDNLDRVFRQVHRVLHTGCPFVLSLPHPVWTMGSGSYFSSRTISDVFTSLVRANFRVDTLLEPQATSRPHGALWEDAMETTPVTLILRARKEGN